MATFPKPLVPVLNSGTFLAKDLVMALPMAEGVGTALSDISGNGHHATIAGVEGIDFQWVDDPEMGVVLELLTASAWVDLAASLLSAFAGQGAATLMAWVKLAAASPPVGEQGLCNLKGSGLAGQRTVYPHDPAGANEILSSVFRDGTRPNIALDVGVDRSQWHLVTITTQNGGFYYVYQNDIQLSGVVAEPIVSLAAPLQFGRSDDTSGSDSLRARVGDIRLFKRAYESYEVGTVFNNPWGLYVFTNPPGQVDHFGLSVEYQPRGAVGASEMSLLVDHPHGAPVALGEFDLLVDFRTDAGLFGPQGGAYDPPVALRPDLSPFRKPALNGVPAPALNTDPITASILLAILYNDPAGAADPLTEYGPASHQVSGISWGVSPADRGNPPGDAAFVLSDQASAAYANGNGGSVPRALSLEPVQAFTVASYFFATGLGSAGAVLVGKLASGGASFAYALRISPSATDRFRFEMTDVVDGVAVVDSPPGQIVAGGSYLVVGTYDGGIMRLYVNGVEVGNQVNGGDLSHDITADLGIGQNGAGGNVMGGHGHTEAVFLWDRALTPAEVAGLHANPFGMFCDSGFVGHFGLSVEYQPRGAVALGELALLVDHPHGAPISLGEFELLADLVPGVSNAAGLTFFSIDPIVGPDQGGQSVVIRGRGFQDITQVLVGGAPLQNLVVPDSGTIIGDTSVHIPGLVNVRIDSATRGFVEAEGVYTFVGGFGPAVEQLIVGKQIDPGFFRQETFTGENAPLGVQTTLALQLADIPIHPDAVEVYVRRLDPGHGVVDDGALLQRQGAIYTYTVDIANRRLVWEPTATFALLPLDEVTVIYLARGEIP